MNATVVEEMPYIIIVFIFIFSYPHFVSLSPQSGAVLALSKSKVNILIPSGKVQIIFKVHCRQFHEWGLKV